MSPDVKRKYELAVGEDSYDVSSAVKDIGDRRIVAPKLISESGIALFFKAAAAPNPMMTVGVPYLSTEAARGVASMATVYETSVS